MTEPHPEQEVARLLKELANRVDHVHRTIAEVDDIRGRLESLYSKIQLKVVRPELSQPGEKRKGLDHVRDFTRDATHLTVIDPYIYSGESRESTRIVEDFVSSACVNKNDSLKSVHVIYNPTQLTKKIRSGIKKSVQGAGKAFTDKPTEAIHDRIWIKNDKVAIVTGTSLNGIGNKLSFILDLPDEDLQDLKKFLRDQSLVKAKT